MTPDQLWQRYGRIWSADPHARATELEACLAESCSYCDVNVSIEKFLGRPRSIKPALTSRNIAELDALPVSARPAFSRIARSVERSFFGGREVDAGDFAECRRAYEAFAIPNAWSG